MTLQRDENVQRELVSADAAGTLSIVLSVVSIVLFVGGSALFGYLSRNDGQPLGNSDDELRHIVDSVVVSSLGSLAVWLMLALQLVAAFFSMYGLVVAKSSSRPEQDRRRAKRGLVILSGFWAFVLCFGAFGVAYYGG
jgi:Na+/proline symporter